MAWKRRVIGLVIALTVVFAVYFIRQFIQQEAAIFLDATTTYQTMIGWEATAFIGQFGWPQALFPRWQNAVLDQAVNDLGINRVRLELQTGAENPVDYFTPYLAGRMSEEEWKEHLNEVINDNDDPQVINPAGFTFTMLDQTIETTVAPLKARLASHGEQLYVNLTVVDFQNPRDHSDTHFQNAPEEYAEFVLAAFLHMQDKYGWTPDAVEVILEPDKAGWGSGQAVGHALVAAAKRLATHGFRPAFIAPSTVSVGNALLYLEQMMQVPGVREYLTEFSYHRYHGASLAMLRMVAARAAYYHLRTAHLEKIGATYADLHQDLKVVNNASWAQYALADATDDNGGIYYIVDTGNPEQPVVNMGSRTKSLRQYFKFIRAGAVRIAATTSNSNFDPVAFINRNGGYVVVIKVDAYLGGMITLHDLPTGRYGIKYTTNSADNIDLPDALVTAHESVEATMPARGVITIYAK